MEATTRTNVAYSPLGRHPLPIQPAPLVQVIDPNAAHHHNHHDTVKHSKRFSKAVFCELIVDNILLAVFYGVCIAMVYMHWAWWIPVGIAGLVHLIALACLITSCFVSKSHTLYDFFRLYARMRIFMLALALLVVLAILVLACICWANGGRTDNPIDKRMWLNFGYLYLVRTGIILVISMWFIFTARSFFHQITKYLPAALYH